MSKMTIEEYVALSAKFGDEKVFTEAREAFFKEHPDCPKPQPIECLNLIMKKEYALDILKGIKKVEVRAYSDHYWGRLYDKKVLEYENKHWDDDLMRMQMCDFNDSVRAVKKIHFYNYNNSWHLDVECIDNNTVVVVDDQVKFLQEEYGCHEFDEMLAEFNKKKEKNRPIFFYFALGKVLDTNLTLE